MRHAVFALAGLIVDFSTTGGVNMWPRVIGLSPRLAEGVVGQFRDASTPRRSGSTPTAPCPDQGNEFRVGGRRIACSIQPRYWSTRV